MKYIFVCLISLLSVSGCSSDTDEVRSTILSYTNIIAKAYSSGEFIEAESVIAQKQIELLKQRVYSFNQMHISLNPVLRSIRFDRVDQASDRVADAVTREAWDFLYFRSGSGKELRKDSFDITVHYIVEKVEETWLVTEVELQAGDTNDTGVLDPFVTLPADMIPTWAGLTSEELLKSTVLAYLQLLTKGYTNQDMSPLSHSATKRRAMKAFYHMSSMGEGLVRMEPELRGIEFVEVNQLQDKSAKVISNERWNYIYYSTQSGDKVYENHASYTLTYDLIKEDGKRWLVDDITIEQMEQGEGKGELPFFSRPHETPVGKGM